MSYLDVKRLLFDKGLNQKQFCELTGLNQSFVSMLSSKKRKLSLESRNKIESRVGDVSSYLVDSVTVCDLIEYSIPLKSKRLAKVLVPGDLSNDDIDSVLSWFEILRNSL